MAGLKKEIWLPAIMPFLWKPGTFYDEAIDMSPYVDNDVLHWQEVGALPAVLVDNATFPVTSSVMNETPDSATLKTFDSETTIIRHAEAIQYAYNKLTLEAEKHGTAIMRKIHQDACYYRSPATDTTAHPLKPTTGADDGSGWKAIKLADIIAMKTRFDKLEIPLEGRIAILHPDHVAALMTENVQLYNQLVNLRNGNQEGIFLAGFQVREYVNTPYYTSSTGVRKAIDAVINTSLDGVSSVFYQKDCAMKAKGSVKVFLKQDDPDHRGDLIGYQARALSGPSRSDSKGLAAIRSVLV